MTNEEQRLLDWWRTEPCGPRDLKDFPLQLHSEGGYGTEARSADGRARFFKTFVSGMGEPTGTVLMFEAAVAYLNRLAESVKNSTGA